MTVYIVTEWNGLGYEESTISNVAAFLTLTEAAKFVKNQKSETGKMGFGYYGIDQKTDIFTIEVFDNSDMISRYEHGTLLALINGMD